MSTIRVLMARPWLATTVAGALAALVLGMIPISYERTAGRDVTLTLSGSNLRADRVRQIAREFKGLLGVERVMVRADERNGRTSFVLSAAVPRRSGVAAAGVARAFARELTPLGYAASAVATNRRERVSGTVYAYALDRVIEINMDGKSAAHLESEIRQRLAEAGVTDAKVSVTDLGDGKRSIQVQMDANHESEGDPNAARHEEAMPELVLKKDGAPVAGHGVAVRIEKRTTPSGTILAVQVQQGGRSATAEVPNPEPMSDAALASEIEAQLNHAGVEVTVTVKDGRVEIRSPHDP